MAPPPKSNSDSGTMGGSMDSISPNVDAPLKQITIITVESGWGSDMIAAQRGPEALLQAGLAEMLDAAVIRTKPSRNMEEGELSYEERERVIAEHVERISDAVVQVIERGQFPVLIGGDHTSAIGLHTGIARVHGQSGIVWIDTHPDLNTIETSPSGHIHGMVLAVLLGRGSEVMCNAASACLTKDNQVAMVCTRDIDAGEQRWLDEGIITCHTMEYVAEFGLEYAITNAIEVANSAEAGFGLTIDLDAIDPVEAPFVATPVDGGIGGTELAQVLEAMPQAHRMLGMEVTEYTPRSSADDDIACKLVASLITAATTSLV